MDLSTERLLLRRWRDSDREPFAALNADPEVMEHFPATMTREQSDLLVDRIEAGFEARGFGLWAVEVAATGEFVGFTGLAIPGFRPGVEIGWRLARSAWGYGYATEAARAVLAEGFRLHGLKEIISFTAVGNLRSRAVMTRIGMTYDPADDFDHPSVPADHQVRRHVLYRISAP
ncbi:N-acetyltransferase [Acrocarpospora phusangensis]|uniref:N-acetyltransferase n=1 Tax=Acrocarpospora phusangensis TaxID=1070424 RepID=A0A919UJT0_9ACTN|nr:GNAT family N-acetyltransferase [Acrocarpospora phusangensis]GIH24196.1 N-acetyltransferase [Acrocarpospora phusangensis]